MGKLEQGRHKLVAAERLARVVGLDVSKPFTLEQETTKNKKVDVTLQPRFLRSLKARATFSLWDDMINLGEGDLADQLIEGGGSGKG